MRDHNSQLEPAPVRILTIAALVVEQRGYVIVGGRLVTGDFEGSLTVRSAAAGDLWVVQKALAFGTGPPNDFDLHVDGKWTFIFQPTDHIRRIEEGEEFLSVAADQ